MFVYDNPLELANPVLPHTGLLGYQLLTLNLLPAERDLPTTLGPWARRFLRIPDFEPMLTMLRKHGAERNTRANRAWFIDDGLVDRIDGALRPLNLIQRNEALLLFPQSDQQVPWRDRVLFYLYTYWTQFHPDFPIIHKPLFDTRTANDLLLLAMMVAGCHYANPQILEAMARQGVKLPEFNVAMAVISQLRWHIFQHPDFALPTKLWVLQALNLVEYVEKHHLDRACHERGHVHHGTTCQLLKRLPTLGGNPDPVRLGLTATATGSLADDLDHEHLSFNGTLLQLLGQSDDELFDKWVHLELMKRVTFLTYYLDSMDMVKFRHDPAVQFALLQAMRLPCESDVWELTEFNGLFAKVVKRQRKKGRREEGFLTGLKRLLKPLPPELALPPKPTNGLAQNCLLAGLVLLMQQMQQMDIQKHLLHRMNLKVPTARWKSQVVKAFDRWFVLSKTRLFIYHLSQVVGLPDITHYDIAIFGGLLANQLVQASHKDYYIVQRKLVNLWLRPYAKAALALTTDRINFRLVIHSLWALWQIFDLHLDRTVTWNLLDLEEMYLILAIILVLWCYVYLTIGVELARYHELTPDQLEALRRCDHEAVEAMCRYLAEDGIHYVNRVRDEFRAHLLKQNLAEYELTVPYVDNGVLLHDKLDKYLELLPQISLKQKIAGLCFLCALKLFGAQWDIVRENAKLILHCGLRLIGKKEILCDNLFENDMYN